MTEVKEPKQEIEDDGIDRELQLIQCETIRLEYSELDKAEGRIGVEVTQREEQLNSLDTCSEFDVGLEHQENEVEIDLVLITETLLDIVDQEHK